MGPHINDEHEAYNPWGRPGAGAPFQREDGKPLEEKLGWSMTGHPKKRTKDAKQEYMNTLQQEMEEKKKKEQEERLQTQEPGAELASIIRKGVGGRPRKDPVTGELLPNPRKLTDVTEKSLDIRRAKSQESLLYFNELAEQAAQRQQMRQQQKQIERAQSEKTGLGRCLLPSKNNAYPRLHYYISNHIYITCEHLGLFLGRPGHGAPINSENHKKENLINLLQSDAAQPYVKALRNRNSAQQT
ncbi:uncharacterized protein CEXT_249821 [Caerostris extrusa]|uniref:Uncharacterized protein n=1 Tax=Caerostris extrusa TaxID=172846 RepID=A0AAV4WB72_CAEEX|nr:uncharacterized protein CEXT_249821 [Caerostris extrusa]